MQCERSYWLDVAKGDVINLVALGYISTSNSQEKFNIALLDRLEADYLTEDFIVENGVCMIRSLIVFFFTSSVMYFLFSGGLATVALTVGIEAASGGYTKWILKIFCLIILIAMIVIMGSKLPALFGRKKWIS